MNKIFLRISIFSIFLLPIFSYAQDSINLGDKVYIKDGYGNWIENISTPKNQENTISFGDKIFIKNGYGQWIDPSVIVAVPKDPIIEKKIIKSSTVEGYSTYYGSTKKFQGRKTASGEIFDRNKLTAASNIFKLGSYVKVTNPTNNKSVVVKINDRMGSKKNIIDLSVAGFKKIANLSTGRIKVRIELIKDFKMADVK